MVRAPLTDRSVVDLEHAARKRRFSLKCTSDWGSNRQTRRAGNLRGTPSPPSEAGGLPLGQSVPGTVSGTGLRAPADASGVLVRSQLATLSAQRQIVVAFDRRLVVFIITLRKDATRRRLRCARTLPEPHTRTPYSGSQLVESTCSNEWPSRKHWKGRRRTSARQSTAREKPSVLMSAPSRWRLTNCGKLELSRR